MHDDTPDADAADAADDRPPCVQALVASTFALMTAYAAPCPNAALPREAQRRLFARKVVSNLFFLQHHPALGAPMRQVMAHAHERWAALAADTPAAPPPAPAARRDLH